MTKKKTSTLQGGTVRFTDEQLDRLENTLDVAVALLRRVVAAARMGDVGAVTLLEGALRDVFEATLLPKVNRLNR